MRGKFDDEDDDDDDDDEDDKDDHWIINTRMKAYEVQNEACSRIE